MKPKMFQPAHTWEQPFSRQVLESEKLRVLLLSIAFVSASYWAFASERFFGSSVAMVLAAAPREAQTWISVYFAAMAAYEWTVGRFFSWLIRVKKPLPPAGPYANALVETSAPTLAMWMASHWFGEGALYTPMALIYFLFIGLSALRLNAWLCVFTGAVACVEYIGLAHFVLQADPLAGQRFFSEPFYMHVNRGVILLLTGLAMGFVSAQIRKNARKAMESVRDRDRIQGLLGLHVSREVAARLLAPRSKNADERMVCVLFLDIRNFTGACENRPPMDTMEYLNTLFKPMIQIVHEHHGIINKFLGDGFLAVFGAPQSNGNDCQNAVDAAREILAQMESQVQKGEVMPTRVGMGLHAGPAVCGIVGSDARQEYTVIGDVVNLAARIENKNKELKSSILISGQVRERLKKKTVAMEDQGDITVRGRKETVRLFRLA